MYTLKWILLGIALGVVTMGSIAGGMPKQEPKHMVSYTSKESFETVKALITDSLTAKGLVINNIAHIGNMLERTGKDLGATKQVYRQAEALEFCSAVVSRKTMEADPHNIVFCPYVIAIYVLHDEPNKTFVSFRKLDMVGTKASRESLKEVEKLLREIIEEAL